MKRQLFLTVVLCLILQVTSFGQSIKLNNEGDPGSAMLEVSSPSKGILIPNVTLTGTTDATTIASPATSLLVYNTATVSDVIPGYYYNSGTSGSPIWIRLSTSTSTGTAGDGSETKVTAGTNVTVTGSGTSASPYVVNTTEVDGDVTNEIQDLSIIGNALKITLNGGATEIDLSSYLDNTDTQLTETEVDAYTANNGYLDTEIDGDVTNEIQDLSISENALTITLNGAATSIDLSQYLDNTDNQTLAEILTTNTSAGSNKITSLADPVSAQDAATKAYVDLLEAEVEALKGVKDIDNNRYDIITIGTQTWMSENLKTTRYNDGSVIPLVTDGTAWQTAGTNASPGYSWYNAPNETTNLITYGALYNWYAINSATNGNKNVCPTGWHVPTDGEWTTLTTYLVGQSVAGGKMKEAGLAHWLSPNIGATNESGFAGLPGGFRNFNGSFYNVGSYGLWWSSSEDDAAYAWFRYLRNLNGNVYRDGSYKGSGFSVRCLRD
jgi:uncharacterized protein (TIGR02145 family)